MTNTNKPLKEVLVDYEEKMSLVGAATFLETIAVKLKEEKSLTLTHGGKTFEVKPSANVELEVKLEKRGEKHKLELELEWIEGDDSHSGLEIG